MNLARVRDTAARLLRERHLPGLVVGIVEGDDLIFAEGFGFADIENGRAQSPSTRHRIGSVSKTMTALCVMTLVDEERLSLDERIIELLPDLTLHGYGDAVTVGHLLAHIGGIGEAPNLALLPRAGELIYADQPTPSSLSETYPDGIDIEVQPGTKWAYANHGYGLLGEIIVRAEDESLNEVMRRRIFEPLGMVDSDILDRPHRSLSVGYGRPLDAAATAADERGGGRPEASTVDGHNVRMARYRYILGDSLTGAGGVQSTMLDLGRFASALLRHADGIVRPETFAKMIAPHWCPDRRLTSQGLGFVRSHRFGRFAIVHAGGVQGGWVTMLTVLPGDNIALIMFLNFMSADLGPVESALLQALLDAPDPVVKAACPTDESILSQAPGLYECTPGVLTNARVIRDQGRVRVERIDGDLYLRSQRGPWSGGVRLLAADATDPTFFMVEAEGLEPAHVALVRGDDGRVSGIRTGVTELVRAPSR